MIKKSIIFILSIVIIILVLKIFIKPKTYLASDFGIEVVTSSIDYDNDGIDDYNDIMLGARMDAINKPKYKSVYYAGGYPPDDEGVCSDVIWRAFKNAGYDLKEMIDLDIKNNPDDYPGLDKVPDPNIDFRRVRNLKVFFDKYATSLTLDPYDIASWQPGDIVVFGASYTHIGIISDKRNKEGIPYLIHNAGQYNREEDALECWYKKSGITGHYRYEGE